MPVWNTCRSSATDVPVLSLCLMLIDFRFLRSSSGFQSTFSDGPQPKKEIAVYHFPYCAISSTYGTTISIDSLVLGGRRRNRFSSSHRRWCHVSFLIFVFPFSGPSFLSRNSKIKRKSATSTSWIFTTRSTTIRALISPGPPIPVRRMVLLFFFSNNARLYCVEWDVNYPPWNVSKIMEANTHHSAQTSSWKGHEKYIKTPKKGGKKKKNISKIEESCCRLGGKRMRGLLPVPVKIFVCVLPFAWLDPRHVFLIWCRAKWIVRYFSNHFQFSFDSLGRFISIAI